MLEVTEDQALWLAEQIEALTTELEPLSPSEWAERHRYLPQQVTPLPGLFSFRVTPYLREIVDCLGVDSPVRKVSFMKGVQVCATTGVLENGIGYYIAHVKSAPMMMVTADAELAQLRMSSAITPMLQHSELSHLIKSTDEGNARKTGKTDKKIEWLGGGFLIPFGAKNANKLRSIPIQVMLRDEIDGWPDVVGKDGDPMKLSEDRTAAYESSRKIVDISTPLIEGQSKIKKQFLLGDQRYYFVNCVKCGHSQTLRWKRTSPTGEVTGIVWDLTEDGRLVPGSVRYLCEKCAHPHTNDDKTRLLAPESGAEWRATEVPSSPEHRSYHLSALYSPVGMQTWEACVQKFLEAFDPVAGRVIDHEKFQVFYNNVLGETYSVTTGAKLKFEMVSAHRRAEYQFGEVPNRWAAEFCGSPVLLLVCAVDVHDDNLAVSIIGWCRDRRAVLISYRRLEGDTEQLDDPGTWGALRGLIDEEFTADDGKQYRIEATLIDSGYRSDQACEFAAEYPVGVFPVKGQAQSPKSAKVLEFSEFETRMGTKAFGISVNIYKDRWSSALRRGWDSLSLQPFGHFNAPRDATDKQLKELTVETRHAIIEKGTNKRLGFEWRRPSGADNELWDLLGYSNAALDIIAWDYCRNQLQLDHVDWFEFYERALNEKLFFQD